MNKFNDIYTERLLLRRFQLEDAEVMKHYSSQPVVMKFQNRETGSLEAMQKFINDNLDVEFSKPGWYQIGIALKSGNEIIGDCGIHFLDDDRISEFGITIAPDYQSNGYATESLKAVFDLLFVTLGKHRVFASVDPDNTASMALMNSLGMRKEAHFVKSLWFKNRWTDDVIFAMLSREWIEIE